MKNMLINCYYEGMSVSEAVNFLEASYHKTVLQKSIDLAVKEIKNFTNKEWK